MKVVVKENKHDAILFFDESRFGTHSKIGHGWFERGRRTAVKITLGYKNFYLYTAVNHISGEHFSLIISNVDTDCMNIFLEQLSAQYLGKKIALIMDGAGWHKSKGLIVPENIEIIYLPPYSPELNPVERLWLHIKSHMLRNKLYESLGELERYLCQFVRSMKIDTVAQICRANYMLN